MANQKRPPRATISPTLPTPLRSRQRSTPSLSTKLDLDSAFFWLLLTFLITTFTFLSFRDKHIPLNTTQTAEYERRSQFLSNSTVYIVEVGRPEQLLFDLSPENWARVSPDVDYVAFVWDDLPIFLTDEWVAATEQAMPKTYGTETQRLQMALFTCGCVLPNRYFSTVKERLAGFECVLLPGWVFAKHDVHWLDVEGGDGCKRRDSVLNAKLARRFGKELKAISETVGRVNQEVETTAVSVPDKR